MSTIFNISDKIKLTNNPFPLLLNTYSGAAAAYSLRLLDFTYSGSAVRVRRASDNAEQDIEFTNNELDTASLESFASGTDAFVTTWYDQSGNGNDVTQTTASNQPKIVSSGSTITEGTKPSIDFLGSQYFPYGSIAFGNDANIVSVVNNDSGLSGIFAVDDNPSANQGMQIWSFQNKYTAFSGGQLQDTDLSENKFAIIQAGRNTSSQFYMRINGTDFSVTPSSQDTDSRAYYIGTIRINQYGFNGRMSEFIVYNQNMYSDIADIETNINTHYSIY